MPRVDAEALPDPVHVYVASSLRAARAVEALLTARGVDYAVEVTVLGRSALFGSLRHGAAFFVSSSQAAACRTLLAENGHAKGLVHGE